MRPAPPEGYDYDVMGDEVLVTRTRVKGGRVLLPDGMSYRLLVLAGGDRLSLAAARQLQALVEAGATVLATRKPIGSPSFADCMAGDAEVRRIADRLWGGGAPDAGPGEKRSGAGRVIWGRSPTAVLAELKIARDFALADAKLHASVFVVFGKTGSAEAGAASAGVAKATPTHRELVRDMPPLKEILGRGLCASRLAGTRRSGSICRSYDRGPIPRTSACGTIPAP